MNNDYINEIRSILLSDWDPLGVGDNPKLIDEYDSYITLLLPLLKKERSKELVMQTLLQIELDLGVHSEIDIIMTVAEKIVRVS